jgi:D-alanyl-D-alanine carboxypeptidase/D-alanyl-D-alanine-endopeptidase (penicillin-binding protein 4)
VLPDPKIVAARLAKVSRDGIGSSGLVVLAADGSTVSARGADRLLAPASTMKVLTSLAALDTVGADHRFTTRVVRSGQRVVLVGGGDPLLTDKQSKSAAKPASLQALAAATATALAAEGVRKVSLGYDTSLFSGPDFNPAWKAKWRSWVPRVSALLIGEGRFNIWQADPAPARTAATAFAKRLRAAGIAVSGIAPATAALDATELASVQSAPLVTVLGRTLKVSDNLAAEVIARHIALASGQKPSFTGAAASLKAWLSAHQLWASGMRVLDGSGLSVKARVTPSVLARAILVSLDNESLAGLASGLPVAGVSGTLEDRFNDKSERIARGNVHAKTGTLAGVAALAGYLTTADGARLAFAIVANQTRGQTTAYNWLDRTTAVLVRCGCR